MNCRSVSRRLAGYLDGAISGREHALVREHLEFCELCREDLERYRRLAVCLAQLEPAVAPADLAVRIRLGAARAEGRAAKMRQTWGRALLVFQNILKPLAVPATGGVLTAVMVFVFVVQSMLVGMPFGVVPNDLPTSLMQPARLEKLAPFPVPGITTSGGGSDAGVLLVEATLNAEGQVVNYDILAGPNDASVRRQIDQVLLFSRFRPQLSFGRPMAGGRVMLSFSEIRVKG
ncbi:MAG: anti-sigma factor [Candidatus Acidiferrales bacterium]